MSETADVLSDPVLFSPIGTQHTIEDYMHDRPIESTRLNTQSETRFQFPNATIRGDYSLYDISPEDPLKVTSRRADKSSTDPGLQSPITRSTQDKSLSYISKPSLLKVSDKSADQSSREFRTSRSEARTLRSEIRQPSPYRFDTSKLKTTENISDKFISSQLRQKSSESLSHINRSQPRQGSDRLAGISSKDVWPSNHPSLPSRSTNFSNVPIAVASNMPESSKHVSFHD